MKCKHLLIVNNAIRLMVHQSCGIRQKALSEAWPHSLAPDQRGAAPQFHFTSIGQSLLVVRSTEFLYGSDLYSCSADYYSGSQRLHSRLPSV